MVNWSLTTFAAIAIPPDKMCIGYTMKHTTTRMRQMRNLQLQVALASIVLASCLGCRNSSREELPKTFPVVGKVVDGAGRPVTSGAVEFVSKADENITTGRARWTASLFQRDLACEDERKSIRIGLTALDEGLAVYCFQHSLPVVGDTCRTPGNMT
jgi:hypothetical protein